MDRTQASPELYPASHSAQLVIGFGVPLRSQLDSCERRAGLSAHSQDPMRWHPQGCGGFRSVASSLRGCSAPDALPAASIPGRALITRFFPPHSIKRRTLFISDLIRDLLHADCSFQIDSGRSAHQHVLHRQNERGFFCYILYIYCQMPRVSDEEGLAKGESAIPNLFGKSTDSLDRSDPQRLGGDAQTLDKKKNRLIFSF